MFLKKSMVSTLDWVYSSSSSEFDSFSKQFLLVCLRLYSVLFSLYALLSLLGSRHLGESYRSLLLGHHEENLMTSI